MSFLAMKKRKEIQDTERAFARCLDEREAEIAPLREAMKILESNKNILTRKALGLLFALKTEHENETTRLRKEYRETLYHLKSELALDEMKEELEGS